MARKTNEEQEAEQQEEQTQEVAPAGVVEVSITKELLNNKLNYIIARIDETFPKK